VKTADRIAKLEARIKELEKEVATLKSAPIMPYIIERENHYYHAPAVPLPQYPAYPTYPSITCGNDLRLQANCMQIPDAGRAQ